MRKIKFNLMIIIAVIIGFGLPCAAQKALSKEDALQIVKNHFRSNDYDYYLCEEQSNVNTGGYGNWVFFVDPAPGKGW